MILNKLSLRDTVSCAAYAQDVAAILPGEQYTYDATGKDSKLSKVLFLLSLNSRPDPVLSDFLTYFPDSFSGGRSILDVDFNRLREMFDTLPFDKKKEFVNTFIYKIVIDPDWYEIHYSIPTGFDPDKFLTSGPNDGGNDGAAGVDSGGKNGRGTSDRLKKYDKIKDVSGNIFFGAKHGEGSPSLSQRIPDSIRFHW